MLTSSAFEWFERREQQLAAADPNHRVRAPRRACADELGLTKKAVYFWGDLVPPLWAAVLQDISGGELVFDPYEYIARGYGRPARFRLQHGGQAA